MINKLHLLIKIFKSLGFTSSFIFILAHVFRIKSVKVFVKELGQKIIIRPWTGDFATIRQVIWDKEYDFQLDKVNSVVDLGANIGIATIILANKYLNATVIAIELESNNFEILKPTFLAMLFFPFHFFP